MSILSLSKNPPARYPSKPIADSTFPWWIAKVKHQHDKSFAFELMKQGVEYYLPMVVNAYRQKDTGKIRKSILPLFPSYVSIATDKPYLLLSNKQVSTIIEIKNQNRFIIELQQIYSAYNQGAFLSPATNDMCISSGQKVRVLSGTLKGLVGKIVRIENQKHLVMQVDSIGTVYTKIDSDKVELLDC